MIQHAMDIDPVIPETAWALIIFGVRGGAIWLIKPLDVLEYEI